MWWWSGRKTASRRSRPGLPSPTSSGLQLRPLTSRLRHGTEEGMKGQIPPRRHILTLLVENQVGVLARIAGLIAAKGDNIDSVSVGETMDASVSRVTLVVHGGDWGMGQGAQTPN